MPVLGVQLVSGLSHEVHTTVTDKADHFVCFVFIKHLLFNQLVRNVERGTRADHVIVNAGCFNHPLGHFVVPPRGNGNVDTVCLQLPNRRDRARQHVLGVVQ